MQDAHVLQTRHQTGRTQVQQQMALAVVCSTSWAFEVVDVATDHFEGSHKGRKAATCAPVRKKPADTALAQDAVPMRDTGECGRYATTG